MPDVPADLAAAVRDCYVPERELGRGGMATVYLAQDRQSHIWVGEVGAQGEHRGLR